MPRNLPVHFLTLRHLLALSCRITVLCLHDTDITTASRESLSHSSPPAVRRSALGRLRPPPGRRVKVGYRQFSASRSMFPPLGHVAVGAASVRGSFSNRLHRPLRVDPPDVD